MKPYQQFIYEDAIRDEQYRTIAVSMFNKFYAALKSALPLENNPDFKEYGRGWVIQAKKLGIPYDDLFFVFRPPNKLGHTAGLGFSDDQPVIVFYVLISPHNSKHLDSRINKRTFVHEFIHYLDWKRTGKRLGAGNTEKSSISSKEYVNNPAELNAFYQETAELINSVWKGNPEIFGNTAQSFIERAYYLMDDGFTSHLTRQNERRLKKRLYSLYKHLSGN